MKLPEFLDEHQRDGIKWILSRKYSYLAHAPGAGKTAQAIVASYLIQDKGQTVFIVPPNLTENWKREICKWINKTDLNTIAVVPLSDKKDKMDWTASFIICPDSMLARPWVLDGLLTIKKKFIAVDEASRFKEDGSQRTIALFGGILKDGIKRNGAIRGAAHGVLLDGSPMPNRPLELWAPVFALSPESIDYMDKQDFGLKFCGATMNKRGQWEFKHSSREDELRSRLTKSFMHVVTEAELKHPERLRSITFINKDVLTARQKAWERQFISKIDFSQIMGENSNLGDIASHRLELGLKKVKWVADYVHDKLHYGKDSVLLFAWHREVCEELARRLEKWRPGLIMGGTTPLWREAAFNRFQTGKIKLLIGNIAAIGRGHNLQAATRVIFAEYSWSDELNMQCEKRASRKGSKHSQIRCEYIVAPKTMDEIVLGSVFNKAKRVKKIIG